MIQLLLEKLDNSASVLAIVLQLFLGQYAYHIQDLANAQQINRLEDQVLKTLRDIARCSAKNFFFPYLYLIHNRTIYHLLQLCGIENVIEHLCLVVAHCLFPVEYVKQNVLYWVVLQRIVEAVYLFSVVEKRQCRVRYRFQIELHLPSEQVNKLFLLRTVVFKKSVKF